MATLRKVRRSKGKGFVYVVDFKIDGKRIRKSTKTDDLGLAKRIRDHIQGMIALKAYRISDLKEKNTSLKAFEEEYITARENIDIVEKTAVMYRRALVRLGEFVGGSRTLRSISRKTIEEYRAKMLTELELSGTTVNIEMRALRASWNWAKQKHRKYVDENVFDGLKEIPVDEKRRRYLSDEEIARLFRAIADPALKGNAKNRANLLGKYARFLLMVGSRRTETVLLQWKHIDFDNRVIVFEKTKTDRTRYVPMNDEVEQLLKGIKSERPKEGPEGYIFPYKDPQSAGRAFRRFSGKAKLPSGITLHSTRHTAATNALRKGSDVLAVKALLGHSCIQTTMLYAKVVPETLVKVVNTLSVESAIESGTKKEAAEKAATASESV
jgi:integrase/recombinase XerD